MDTLSDVLSQLQWHGNAVKAHQPASQADMEALIQILQSISPNLTAELRINRANAAKDFPQLMRVFEMHMLVSPYHLQFFKTPLEAPCNCVGCMAGLFKPVRMPMEVLLHLQATHRLPLPVPDSRDASGRVNHYKSFDSLVGLPVDGQHQPSLISKQQAAAGAEGSSTRGAGGAAGARKRKVSGGHVAGKAANLSKVREPNNQHLVTSKIRQAVACKECGKLRCIYSAKAYCHLEPLPPADGSTLPPLERRAATQACRELARAQVAEAATSEEYVCGMGLFDDSHPLSSMFFTRVHISCSDRVEWEYYGKVSAKDAKKWQNLSLCAACGGSSGEAGIVADEDAQMFAICQPICHHCRSSHAKPINKKPFRTAQQKATAAKVQLERTERRQRAAAPAAQAQDAVPQAPAAPALAPVPAAGGVAG
jgi:hypothetical protein